MNTFSENGNDFVGRLLHEGEVSRRTFSAFPQTQTASTVRQKRPTNTNTNPLSQCPRPRSDTKLSIAFAIHTGVSFDTYASTPTLRHAALIRPLFCLTHTGLF